MTRIAIYLGGPHEDDYTCSIPAIWHESPDLNRLCIMPVQ